MSEDRSEKPKRSWLNVLSAAFIGEPQDREQLLDVLRDAEQRELLDGEALSMIESAMRLSEMRARDVMTPRTRMVFAKTDQPLETLVSIANDSEYSRLPLFEENEEQVKGVLLVKDLLEYFSEQERANFQLSKILRPAFFVPESKRLNSLLREFQTKHNHMAVVIDEYGDVTGLVTIEDVIEQIVGEIEDEHDVDEDADNVVAREGGLYTVKAVMPVEDFNHYFGVELNGGSFDTIGGVLLNELGYLPKRGEVIEIEGFRLTVLHADDHRLRLLEVQQISS
jgi:magnesium and cobalt transporter